MQQKLAQSQKCTHLQFGPTASNSVHRRFDYSILRTHPRRTKTKWSKYWGLAREDEHVTSPAAGSYLISLFCMTTKSCNVHSLTSSLLSKWKRRAIRSAWQVCYESRRAYSDNSLGPSRGAIYKASADIAANSAPHISHGDCSSALPGSAGEVGLPASIQFESHSEGRECCMVLSLYPQGRSIG